MRYICSFIVLVSVLGLLINCNGKRRPFIEEPEKIQISFSKDISPLFETHCIFCHVENASPPDTPRINWLNYATAKSYADNGKLRDRVWDLWEESKKKYEAGDVEDAEDYENFAEYEEYLEEVMPQGNPESMTEEQRKIIRDWIDAGALE